MDFLYQPGYYILILQLMCKLEGTVIMHERFWIQELINLNSLFLIGVITFLKISRCQVFRFQSWLNGILHTQCT